ncbi:glycerol-3-phosphate dehydrogenase/oxidase [Salinisphaera sp. Q1T1-3]|uniref:glycerol-3-phosphate dehydrogenase/oxidase n=1 Tax=Salinisphaera sp. Q1T1-3 TaxID=2321229 RepID=UPI000E731B66|nr:glycerol-3-phosphate dehydrogenase/oxidase [Salinisphaera sp. Q1T1-3]RJS91153.1 glycerol-3-phosphate dehydrogenase/oxidase [Salinisphaera sp. Q1T1-3]
MQLRESNIEKLADDSVYDTLIIGGGINGAVSAAALAGRGVKVGLVDQGDFAGMTSMWSSNLIWGGIKYMESYDFKLVRELCVSRNHLITHYPSTVQEIRFLTTITKGFRWHPLVLWAGTWIYWFFGNCFTKIPRLPKLTQINEEESVINTKPATGCFEYSDAFLHDNDARFVWNFVRKAMNSGCVAANYVEATGFERRDDIWHVGLRDVMSGREWTVQTKTLVNACGPLADRTNALADKHTEHSHVLSKGIHLIVNQVTPNKRVLAFFDEDGRLFFAIPMGNRTCIGTTDTRTDDPHAAITDEDIDFVLNNINARLDLDKPLDRADIIATRCGVRPLAVQNTGGKDRDFLQLSRKHEIDSDIEQGFVSIFGGKLTDCVNVGEEITNLVKEMGIRVRYPRYRWYGEPVDAVRDEFFHQAQLMDLDAYTSPASSEPLSTRLWRRYAAHAIGILENIREDPRQAEILIEGTEYIRAEVRQAARREMITKLEDFLRRRSKISLVSRQETIQQSDGLMEACEMLFGDDAKMRFDEYFRDHPITNGIARDPGAGPLPAQDASNDDATVAMDESKQDKKVEGGFETLNW